MKYVRRATDEDIERIRFIVEKCWTMASGDPESKRKINSFIYNFYSYGKLTHEINANLTTFLLAIEGDLAVAFASYRLDKSDGISNELNALYCLPQTQGKRFDEMLVNEVIRNTIEAGVTRIFVILTNYTGTIDLFKRMGFAPVNPIDTAKQELELMVTNKNLQ